MPPGSLLSLVLVARDWNLDFMSMRQDFVDTRLQFFFSIIDEFALFPSKGSRWFMLGTEDSFTLESKEVFGSPSMKGFCNLSVVVFILLSLQEAFCACSSPDEGCAKKRPRLLLKTFWVLLHIHHW